MNKLYTNIFNERNKILRLNEPDSDSRVKVLSELVSIAFQNTKRLDELPHQFTLKDVWIKKEDLEELLRTLGINSTINLLFKDSTNKKMRYEIIKKKKV